MPLGAVKRIHMLIANSWTPQQMQALPGPGLVRCNARDEVSLAMQCTLVKLQVPMLCILVALPPFREQCMRLACRQVVACSLPLDV